MSKQRHVVIPAEGLDAEDRRTNKRWAKLFAAPSMNWSGVTRKASGSVGESGGY